MAGEKQFLPETFLIQIELASGQKCAGGSLVVNFSFQAAPFSTCSCSFCFSHHCSEQWGCEQVPGAEGDVYRLILQPQAFTKVTERGSAVLAFLLCLEAGSSVAHWALAAACPQPSKSSLISLSDGQMKARLLSMQRAVQFVLRLKNDKGIFTCLARNFFTLFWIKTRPLPFLKNSLSFIRQC